MYQIYEDRFLLEEGVYWRYTTDEKINIDHKDTNKLFKLFFNDYLTEHSFNPIGIVELRAERTRIGRPWREQSLRITASTSLR